MNKQQFCFQPKRILVVRLGAFGDVVNTLPAFEALRHNFPHAFIGWLVEDKWKSLLEGYPGLDTIIPFEKSTLLKNVKSPLKFPKAIAHSVPFIKNLRKLDFDTAIDFHGNLKSGILTKLSGAKQRIGFTRGFCREANYLFTNIRIVPGPKMQLRAEKNLGLLKGLGLDMPAVRKISFPLPEGSEKEARAFLKSAFAGRPYVVIHAGTSRFGAYKRWPAENFARLGCRIAGELHKKILLTWAGAEECGAVEKIRAQIGADAVLAPEIIDLKILAFFLQEAELFIGADTGPLHLAASVGTPCAALFGPKDPAVYAPFSFGPKHAVIRKNLPCSPCKKRACKDPVCMTSMTVDEVFRSTAELHACHC
ncbi:MAG: glycosyltransferase family 9 protein [Planctomycetes bacterium]|nr:glycosyltransferase family 9 protein [Planctomycetota bacterium]